jgi:hypothetical protein
MRRWHFILLLFYFAPGLARAQWLCEIPAIITVYEPADISGEYGAGHQAGGAWADTTGLNWPGTTGTIVHVEDPGVDPLGLTRGEGCAPLTNHDEIAGNIAFIRRGECEFGLKALRAQEAGAIGFMVYNDERVPDDDDGLVTMQGGTYGIRVFIPGTFVSRATGLAFLDAMETSTVELNMVYSNCGIAIEPYPDGTPGAHALSHVTPNPSAGLASFTLEVTETQPVRVVVYDALGKAVAVLHDGLAAAGIAHPLAFDGARLPAGLYVIRVTGERFADARKVVLTR